MSTFPNFKPYLMLVLHFMLFAASLLAPIGCPEVRLAVLQGPTLPLPRWYFSPPLAHGVLESSSHWPGYGGGLPPIPFGADGIAPVRQDLVPCYLLRHSMHPAGVGVCFWWHGRLPPLLAGRQPKAGAACLLIHALTGVSSPAPSSSGQAWRSHKIFSPLIRKLDWAIVGHTPAIHALTGDDLQLDSFSHMASLCLASEC